MEFTCQSPYHGYISIQPPLIIGEGNIHKKNFQLSFSCHDVMNSYRGYSRDVKGTGYKVPPPMMPIFILILLRHFDSKIPPCHTDGWPDENQFRSLSQKFQLGINRSEHFKSKPLELKNAKCVLELLDDKSGCQLVCGSAGCYLNLNVGIWVDGEWRGDGTL